MSHVSELLANALALHRNGALSKARSLYLAVLEQDPCNADAYHLLSLIEHRQGDERDALDHINKAVALAPGNPLFLYDRGIFHRDTGETGRALDSFQKAIDIKNDFPEALNEAAHILRGRGSLAEAIAYYRLVTQLRPGDYAAFNNLGASLSKAGETETALRVFESASRLQPMRPEIHYNLGLCLAELGRYSDARKSFADAVSLNPQFCEALNDLGNACLATGNTAEAMRWYRKTLAVNPGFLKAHSNLVLAMNYRPSRSLQEMFAEHIRFGKAATGPTSPPSPPPARRLADGRIAVGYFSPDFTGHPVGFFLEALLRFHDRTRFSVFCYNDSDMHDDRTALLKSLAPAWRETAGVKHAHIKSLVSDDEIAICVDCAGHTAGNRLPLFARRIAPIQVTYVGYPNTTGLPTMDFRITDTRADPPGQEQGHTEKLVRCDPCFLCWTPPAYAPRVSVPPAATHGYVTFGSFNHLPKITDPVIETWAAVLNAVPKSRIVLKAKGLADSAARIWMTARLHKHGIDPRRIELLERVRSPRDHLAQYDSIDIALDTFPYNGTTTTCEALWMGVPVITLTGERHAERVGTSLLHAVGLPECIAASIDEYTRLATDLARDTERRTLLRSALRERVSRSPLCDGRRFTQNIETLYEKMVDGQL